jgi:hypothetical protein
LKQLVAVAVLVIMLRVVVLQVDQVVVVQVVVVLLEQECNQRGIEMQAVLGMDFQAV